MEWKDTTSHSKYSSNRDPRTLKATIGQFTLTVTRHIDHPNSWVAMSDLFRQVDLETDDIERAKELAVSYLFIALKKQLTAIKEALDYISNYD